MPSTYYHKNRERILQRLRGGRPSPKTLIRRCRCGVSFRPSFFVQIHCSRRCRGAASKFRNRTRADVVTFACGTCGVECSGYRRRRYCSPRCRRRRPALRRKWQMTRKEYLYFHSLRRQVYQLIFANERLAARRRWDAVSRERNRERYGRSRSPQEAQYHAQYQRAHPEKSREYSRRYRLTHPERYRALHKAARANRPFGISAAAAKSIGINHDDVKRLKNTLAQLQKSVRDHR